MPEVITAMIENKKENHLGGGGVAHGSPRTHVASRYTYHRGTARSQDISGSSPNRCERAYVASAVL
jgi:hypothetical protein